MLSPRGREIVVIIRFFFESAATFQKSAVGVVEQVLRFQSCYFGFILVFEEMQMDVVAHLASETKVVSVQRNIHFRDLLAALEAAFDTNTLHITAIRSTSNGHLDASGSSSMGTSLLETFEEV